jgi:hypothetical protein
MHKATLSCDGKREKNVFVKRNEMNINTVFSDAVFLQEIKAAKLQTGATGTTGAEKNNQFQANNLKMIVKNAANNNITVRVMPSGLSRAKLNQSKYIKKRKEVSWTLEWIFQDEDDTDTNDVSVINHRYTLDLESH